MQRDAKLQLEYARRERFAEAERARKKEENRKVQEWYAELNTIKRVFHSKAKPSARAQRNRDRNGKQNPR